MLYQAQFLLYGSFWDSVKAEGWLVAKASKYITFPLFNISILNLPFPALGEEDDGQVIFYFIYLPTK